MTLDDRQAPGALFRTRAGVTYVALPDWEADGRVVAGFSLRCGGVSPGVVGPLNLGFSRPDTRENVQENYRRVCRAMGADVSGLVVTKQVHKDGVLVATGAHCGLGWEDYPDVEADACITRERGVLLAKLHADCVPVLLYDPDTPSVGAVHAGWRGTVARIAQKTVAAMRAQFGADPAHMRGAIGPCIGPCCFEVDMPVAEAFTEALGGAYVHADGGGKYHIDLWRYNRDQLLEAGLAPEHITCTNLCTRCGDERYFHSYRKNGPQTGSHAALIMLK